MGDNMLPFNIELLMLDKENISQLGEVKSLDIFENNSKEFKLDGLFSTIIFGDVGSELRNLKFGYIDLKVKVFHPLIYLYIISLKALYKDILSGKSYAIFDTDIKDFVLSNQEYGETGFEFFIKHFEKVDLKDNDSDARRAKIELIRRYKLKDLLIDKYLVIPAGLREYVIDKSGKPSEDEVNSLYRNLLKSANLIVGDLTTTELNIINNTRYRIQVIGAEIYEHYESLLKGKKKFIQNKWSKRAVTNSSRNVATIYPLEDLDLKTSKFPGFNDTVIGLYQYVKGILPVFSFKVKEKFLNRIFNSSGSASILVNIKTNKTEYIDLDPNLKDSWLSDEGINSMVNKLAQEELRNEPVIIDNDYYLALIYDDGKNIYVIEDTENIPDEYSNSKYIRAITYTELLFLSIYDVVNKYPVFITRYPASKLGGIYPSKVYLKVTNKSRKVTLKTMYGKEEVEEYPILKSTFFNSVAVNSTHVSRLNLDYDGDTLSVNIMYSKDSMDEIDKLLRSRDYYVTYDNKLTYSVDNTVLSNVVKTMNKNNKVK